MAMLVRTRGYIPLKPPFCWLNPIQPPLNHNFPMVFLWFCWLPKKHLGESPSPPSIVPTVKSPPLSPVLVKSLRNFQISPQIHDIPWPSHVKLLFILYIHMYIYIYVYNIYIHIYISSFSHYHPQKHVWDSNGSYSLIKVIVVHIYIYTSWSLTEITPMI